MSIHLMCLTTNGGLPLFNRKRGDCQSLPFSTVASLNGSHMFCKSQGVKLKTTKAEDWTLHWEEFENSLTMIVVGKDINDKTLHDLLYVVFGCLVLFIGLDEIKSTKCVERMKREAKNYIPIVDKLLEICDDGILNYSQCILAPENIQLTNKLNEFSSLFGSLFCAITISNRVAVATEGWWDLDALDRNLLMVILSTSEGPKNDIPVYLPHKSPNTAYRFVTVPITASAILCVLCGAEPQYHDIINNTHQVFKSDIQLLHNAEKYVVKNLPDYWEMDPKVLGILLLKTTQRKYVTCMSSTRSQEQLPPSDPYRLDILRSFFVYSLHNVSYSYFDDPTRRLAPAKVRESYGVFVHEKCHAFSDKNGNLICVLYDLSVPIEGMRAVSEIILIMILQDKSICW